MINQLSTVAAVRSRYPTPLGGSHAGFLIEVAKATGAKLLRKDSGSHVTLPNGVNVSQDILMFDGQGVDILSDGEGAATPAWQEKGPIGGEYIDMAVFPNPTPTPTPTPVPTTDPAPEVDLSGILGPVVAVVHGELDRLIAAIQSLEKTINEKQFSVKLKL